MSLIHFISSVLDSGFDFHVAFNGVYQAVSWCFTD